MSYTTRWDMIGRGSPQALRQHGSRRERLWLRPVTLPLPRLRLQSHGDAGVLRARGDEGLDRGSRAVLLYAMGNACYGTIARLFDVSDVAVCNWRRKAAAALPEPSTAADVEIVQQGEMRHVVDGKKQTLAMASLRPAPEATPLITQGARLLGRPDAATCPQRPGKVGSEGRVFLTDDREGRHLTKDR